MQLHLERAQLRAHELGAQLRGLQLQPQRLLLALSESPVVAPARLHPMERPVGEHVAVEAEDYQGREQPHERRTGLGREDAELDRRGGFERELQHREHRTGEEMERDAAEPPLALDRPATSEPEDRRRERRGDVGAEQPRGEQRLPGRRIVPEQAPCEVAAEEKQPRDRPREAVGSHPREHARRPHRLWNAGASAIARTAKADDQGRSSLNT